MRKYKILVVDDEPHFLKIMEQQLIMRGYPVVTPEDGFDGFTAAIRERPDQILTDIMMPTTKPFDNEDLMKAIDLRFINASKTRRLYANKAKILSEN